MEINERAVRANSDETEFERLLREYRPFIASCAYKTIGKHTDIHDDAMSIAMIAFEESVRRYNPKAGNFLAFAGNVIRCRLIDHMRMDQRNAQVVSLDSYVKDSDEKDKNRDKVQYDYLSQKPQSKYDDPVKLEVDELSAVLAEYGLTFSDVAKCSPKARKTKTACRKVAKALFGDKELYADLKRTKQLPVQQLENISGASRKTIARHRNYIVCLAEILSGEYTYLSQYVKCAEDGGKQ
ncbi:MAG: sigma-70 family RNA polymerase sigma factor [Bacillota bacterium]